ncbi:hypothetical protein BofuT4_uP048050.1 [Botrytis cinerea T4]|uniref:Uncharacterized protein n=1 Tax=Botryotinia fuckeliana (strain T4) TaxID=999810 RepID=G2XZA0_BOTF4|nr:hypothetical protein BofuT4_uP048050.1 [Botrytis cinerea T4]
MAIIIVIVAIMLPPTLYLRHSHRDRFLAVPCPKRRQIQIGPSLPDLAPFGMILFAGKALATAD